MTGGAKGRGREARYSDVFIMHRATPDSSMEKCGNQEWAMNSRIAGGNQKSVFVSGLRNSVQAELDGRITDHVDGECRIPHPPEFWLPKLRRQDHRSRAPADW